MGALVNGKALVLSAQTHMLIMMVLFNTSCGVREALDATKSMPRKIDTTNEQVKKSNRGIQKTNTHVKLTHEAIQKSNEMISELLNELKKTNTGIGGVTGGVADQTKKATDQLNRAINEIQRSNDNLDRANEATHNQTLAFAFSEMMRPENTKYLYPPTAMMPAGQVYAEEARPEEIARLVHTLINDIETVRPDDSERDDDGNWREETIRFLDHSKKAKFIASMVIAGLASEEKFESLIQTQIRDGGRFEETTHKVLIMRYAFIHDFLLNDSLFKSPLSNPGLIEEAIRLAESLDRISSSEYADDYLLRTRGMLDPANNIVLSVDRIKTYQVWSKIDAAFDTELNIRFKDASHKAAPLLTELRAKVKTHLGVLKDSSERGENRLAGTN